MTDKSPHFWLAALPVEDAGAFQLLQRNQNEQPASVSYLLYGVPTMPSTVVTAVAAFLIKPLGETSD